MSCVFCTIRDHTSGEDDSFLVHRFPLSDLRVGSHQFYKGYCVLVYRDHVIEPTDLSQDAQSQFFQELMIASGLIQSAFKPHKMNFSCYGNLVPHMHWHLFPRYSDDPKRLDPPFSRMHLFDAHKTSQIEATALVSHIRSFIR
ncbi:MAG: HIT family protein [Alphaproteobacteria bacterium]|nr:HIT family protein [Alphaproteobacteria bacterium]